jgi:hypothetical protein
VSYDKATLAGHLKNHLLAGHSSPGIFAIRRRTTLREVVSFLVLAAYASDADEWANRIHFVG